jgi:hypothetical protein
VVLVNGLHDLSVTMCGRPRPRDQGLLVSRKDNINGSEEELEGGIVVEKCTRVDLAALYQADEIVQDTLELLAHGLRCFEITRELTAIEDREPSQYEAKLKSLGKLCGRW